MIILTDKKLVIPVGIAPNYAGAGNADVKLQAKSVTITKNGSKTLFPDSNYNGFSQVNITTNVANNPVLEDKSVEIIENGDYSFIPGPTYDGIGNFRLKVNVETHAPIQVQAVKTAYPSFENDVTVIPSEGYEAMSSVIVKKAEVNLQSKSVTINENGSTSFTPDANFMGLSKIDITTNVELNPVLETRNEEITENGSYKFTPSPAYDGIGNLDLVVNVPEQTKVESSKTAYPSFEQDVTVTPSVGFDAMGTVIVKKAEPNLQDKTVNKASTSEVVLRADAGYQGLGTVTVAPIKVKTMSFDPSTNVQEFSANTENNEYITNVTVNPVKTTSINVDPSTNSQVVNAPENEYITSVTVNPVGTKTVTLDSSTIVQTVNANVEGNEYITSVTVNPVKTTSLSITPRIVEQTFTAEQQLYKTVNVSAIKHTEKTYDASTNTQTYNYAENNDVFIKNLTINPVTSSIDPNIVPENIAKGVSILGVDGTLEQSSSDITYLIKSTGAPYSAKLKVYQVYLEDKNDSLYGAYDVDVDLRSGDAGTSGYIPFFIKNVPVQGLIPESVASKLGTIGERGIIAVVVNGVVYENPTSFNIPYTKVNDGSTNYDDVTVDVYIDFEKANARAEFIENGNITGTDQNFDVNTYKYLPPIFNGINYEYFNSSRDITTIFETVETYVRQPVNALSKYFLTPTCGTFDINVGNMTFLLGKDGIKRVPDKPRTGTYQLVNFNNVTFYGNVNNYKNIQFWFDDNNYNVVVYGNVNGFDQTKQLPESSKSTTFFGNVSTPIGYYDEYRAQFMGVDSSICDFSENITVNAYKWKGNDIKADVVIMPSTLEQLYANYSYELGKFRWYFKAKTYVFFSLTPPTMPDNIGGKQHLLEKGNGEYNPLTTVYIPVGADYSSIISTTKPPTIIEFTPVSSTSEINGPGIYGLTDYRGYHSLIEIKSSTQAELDLQTVATEINTL